MKTTIDKAGRVVIPKSVRDLVGLQPGMELEIRTDNGVVQILPPPPRGRLVEENGFLVWEAAPGTTLATMDEINESIRLLREEPDRF